MSDNNNVSTKKQDINDDNQQEKFVPELRFPEFTDEWRSKKLGDLSDVTKLAGFEFTKYVNYSDNGNIIALRGVNIKKNKLDLTDVKYIDNSDFNKLNRSKLYPGDLLFTYVGTIGNVALIFKKNKYYLAPNVCRIRSESFINSQFLKFYFNTQLIKKEINRYVTKSSQPALSMENIRKFNVNIPNIKEQNKIANFISLIDRKIDLLEKTLCLHQKYEKQLRENIFNFKMNNINFKRYSLGDIAEIKKGFTPSTKNPKYWNYGKYHWLSIADMDKKYITNSKQKISEEAIKNKEIIKKDTLIMSFKLTIGKLAILKEDMYTNEAIANFTWKNDKISTEYMYFYLKTLNIKKYGSQAAKGITLNNDTLNAIPIMLPEFNIQLNIVNILLTFNKKIELINEKLNNLKYFKKFLLQKMFI